MCGGACGGGDDSPIIAGDVRTESALWAETHTYTRGCAHTQHPPGAEEKLARESIVYPEAIRSETIAIKRDDSAARTRAKCDYSR